MISVAMTTYNGEKFIEEQIKSILEQTLPADEIIICDDGSTDRTCEIIENFNDKRIRLIQNEDNLGYIRNFYKSISLTSGNYIFLADQDDVWHNNKIHEMIKHIQQTGAMAVCSNYTLIDANGSIIENTSELSIDSFIQKCKNNISKISTFRLAFGNIAQGCTYCFDSKVKDVYLKIQNNEVVHDLQIMIIASCMGEVHFINQKLIDYRIHSNNSIGFTEKGNKLEIPRSISKEPFMYRFFKQLNNIIKVKNLWLYGGIYYLRIPFLRAILRRKLRID